MSKRILWLARQRPLIAETTELERLWPGHRLIWKPKELCPYEIAKDVIAKLRREEFDELVVIGPMSLLYALCQEGYKPIKPVMAALDGTDDINAACETIARCKTKRLRFMRFVRVVEVNVVTESLGAA